jgi:hypothetical protein
MRAAGHGLCLVYGETVEIHENFIQYSHYSVGIRNWCTQNSNQIRWLCVNRLLKLEIVAEYQEGDAKCSLWVHLPQAP